jgi:hypothetical protein
METVLIGFSAWLACALVCVTFVVSICRSGQLEDQWATSREFAAGETADPVQDQRPTQDVPRAGSIVHPRSALDDAIDVPARASVSARR